MKINKKSPKHWYYLAKSTANILSALPFRFFGNKNDKPVIVFYDQMNGNTKAFVDYLKRYNDSYCLYYLAYPEYHKSFPIEHPYVEPLSPLKFADMIKVLRSDVIITNFGLQAMFLILKLTNIKFIDVWHGIPYKGFVPKDFFFLADYEEVWVSSKGIKQLYVKKFGVPEEKVIPTGYARVDALASSAYSKSSLRKKYDIDQKYKKIVCVAPTWKQDDKGRSIIPFGVSEKEFLLSLNDIAAKNDSLLIFRAHRGSGDGVRIKSLSNMKIMPGNKYPDTEEILYMSDVLVTDWSSIAFDYLPLERPTIFLDIEPPFKHGLSLGEEHRFGKLVGDINELCSAIDLYINKPDVFLEEFKESIEATKEIAYGNTLDGKSSHRYHKRLKKTLLKNK